MSDKSMGYAPIIISDGKQYIGFLELGDGYWLVGAFGRPEDHGKIKHTLIVLEDEKYRKEREERDYR